MSTGPNETCGLGFKVMKYMTFYSRVNLINNLAVNGFSKPGLNANS